MTTMGMMALTGLGLSSTAQAGSSYEPYMWGVGGKLGTVVIPGAYPASFPDNVNKYDFNDDGERDRFDGQELFSTLRRVKGDIRLAADGFVGIDASNRIGATIGVNTAKGFTDTYLTLNYDNVFLKKHPFNAVWGASVGYGGLKWKGVEDEESPGLPAGGGFAAENETLKMPYFPIKARVEGQFKTDEWMFGLGAFGGTGIPSSTTYTDLRGQEQEKVGSIGNALYLLNVGVEVSVRYGDFKPPKNNKPPKGKGKNKGGNSGNRGGKGKGNGGGKNKGGGKKGGGKKGGR
jgi:hypothetical protein